MRRMNNMNYALKLNNVTKTYKNSDFSLKKVSFRCLQDLLWDLLEKMEQGKQLLSGVFTNAV